MRIIGFCIIIFAILGIVFGTKGPLDIVAFIVFLLVGVALIKRGGAGKSSSSGSKGEATNQRKGPSAHHTTTTVSQTKPEKAMVCAECGRKYPMDQVYCDECGSLLKEYF